MEQRTEIASIGEFGLIDRIAAGLTIKHSNSVLGIGDDASVLNAQGQEVLTSTELFIEGIHFDLAYTPLPHLGFKLVSVALSDLAAMNGLPVSVHIGLGLSNRFSVEAVEAFYQGVQNACETYGVEVSGGDTTSAPQGLVVALTVQGLVPTDLLVKRTGAKVNDVVCATGDFGAALMGLQVLEREKQVFLANPGMQPELEGKSYVILRQLKPEARFDIIHELRNLSVLPHAMIDCSDGLAAAALHLSNANGLGIRLFEKNIPIDEETYLVATELNFSPLTAALNGGEDYELLFTLPPHAYERISKLADVAAIGYMTADPTERVLVMKSEQIVPLTAPGFGAPKA